MNPEPSTILFTEELFLHACELVIVNVAALVLALHIRLGSKFLCPDMLFLLADPRVTSSGR